MKIDEVLQTPALLVLLTISAYCSADTLGAVIGRSFEVSANVRAPQKSVEAVASIRALEEYSSILDRGFFGEGSAPAAGLAPAVTTVYTLVGTVEGILFSGAVLQDGAGQAFYAIHRTLPDGSSVIKVMRDTITLRKSDGSTFVLELVDKTKIVALRSRGGGGVKQLSDGKYLVDQREVLASTENMGQVLTQARALPYMEHGKTVGFKLDEIMPNSIYAKIGLQNGDVIQRVNSQEINDPAKFFQLYQGLRTESAISIDLFRNGQRQTLNYEIR